ncbi:alpha/beta fold hydrolase [Pyrinomonas methylaliphatogenes]|uniref:Predicted hydrolase or acyltransferase of alpha/beta superfamily n=1 Tax=Pyrinomonas methylaliphatogenes TaxID=454194 RepID=A0A0B6WV44_9BACT|nr:alpha/beta hydrolase [Pyrinomonas methylaliphatogenes]CDM65163.1 predicted hydrolase or acyltransferase of alpha/beta superfamily [Pyrinomonas methylaliphatogenes]
MATLRRSLAVIGAIFVLVACGAAQVAVLPEGHFAKVNGIELYYEIHGQGEPLLLIHGFGGSGQDWAPVLEEFAKHYRVILPDMRGHGRSTNPTKQFTHRQSALDMFALLDLLGVKTFKAMGISSGGMTLLHMATQQPSRVEAMVLIGATSYFPEPARQIMRRSTVESMTAQEWERARRIHKYGDDQIRMLREQFHRFKDSYDDMNFTRPLLSTITAKTLIIHGDRDQFFPVSIPVEEYCAIPNSFLWIIPNGGHVPIAGNVQEFTRITLQFLSGAWDQSKKPWDCHAATEK